MTIKITWLSHSGFKLSLGETSILIDPFITGNPLATVNVDTLPADYILLTHGHHDHFGDTLEIAQRTNAQVIATAEICHWLASHNIRTHAQNTGGSYLHPFGDVKFVKAEHSSSLPDGTYAGQANGIVLHIDNKTLYFAGDTALFSDMGLIAELGIDVAFLPIGDNFTMGPADSLRAIDMIRPRTVFPIHYNTFPVIQQDVVAWARRVQNETQASPMITDPGTEFSLE